MLLADSKTGSLSHLYVTATRVDCKNEKGFFLSENETGSYFFIPNF
jgi:hypothetical protein